MIGQKSVLYISYDSLIEPLSEAQVLPYIKGLAGDWTMFLLTFDKKRMKKKVLKDISQKNKIEKIFSLRYHKNPILAATCIDILCGILRSILIIKEYRISLIHSRSYVACFIALALKKILGVPYIFDIRGLLADERVDSGDWEKGSTTYKIVKHFEKMMLREADKIVVLSRKGKEILEEITGLNNKISVIPTCVDVDLFSPSPNTEDVYGKGLKLVYIGSLGTWYMISEMLDFFKILNDRISNSKFLIVTQSDQSIVSRLLEEKKINRDLVEIKKDSYVNIPSYLDNQDLSIFFIKPTFSKKASCPTKFAESLSMGLPVIVNSGVGDLDYYIRKHSVGVIVEAFNERCYKKTVEEVLGLCKENKETIRNRCQGLAMKEFTLGSGIGKYNKIYRSVI